MKPIGMVIVLMCFFLSIDAFAGKGVIFDSNKQTADNDQRCMLSCQGKTGKVMRSCMQECSKKRS